MKIATSAEMKACVGSIQGGDLALCKGQMKDEILSHAGSPKGE